MLPLVGPIGFAVCLLLTIASAWLGLSLGRHVKQEMRPESSQLSNMQNALLVLLALLLGFALAGAMDRFIQRQDSLAREAGDIETAYERAALLRNGDAVQARLREYAAGRLRLYETVEPGKAIENTRELMAIYDAAHAAALEGVRADPQYAETVLPAVEEVRCDLTVRNALVGRGLAGMFLASLFACCCVTMATIGYGTGTVERQPVGTMLALAGLVGTALYLTLDFDHPREGFIRISAAPLQEMVARLCGE